MYQTEKDGHSLHFFYTLFASFHVFGDIFPDCYTFIPTMVYKLNNWLIPFCLFQPVLCCSPEKCGAEVLLAVAAK